MRLPAMREWAKHSVFRPLTAKKCAMEIGDGVVVEHVAERDNAVEKLLEIENKAEDEERERREKEKEVCSMAP